MKLLVEQVYPLNPENVAVLVREVDGLTMAIQPGGELRCLGYRYRVVGIRGGLAQQVGLELKSQHGIRPGMVLRPVEEALSTEEMMSMLMRASHVLHCLTEMCCEGMGLALASQESPITQALQNQGFYQEALSVFYHMRKLQEVLPPLEKQREFGAVISKLNELLKLMPMANPASIGA